jgi:hypothetical protein
MSDPTSFQQYKFAPFQSGMGMCNPSTDFSGSKKGGSRKSKKMRKGGNPARYFNPNSSACGIKGGAGRTSVCNASCSGPSKADTGQFIKSTSDFSAVRKSQAGHAVEILSGGGSDWSMSQRSRSLQPVQFSWTDLADFHAFTKTPYISPQTIVKGVMPPSAAQPTTIPDGFDPMGTEQGAIGGGFLNKLFGKTKKKKKKAASKKKKAVPKKKKAVPKKKKAMPKKKKAVPKKKKAVPKKKKAVPKKKKAVPKKK